MEMSVDTSYDAVSEFINGGSDIDRKFPVGPVISSQKKAQRRKQKQKGISLAEACVENESVDSLRLLVASGCSTKNLLQNAIKAKKKNVFDALIDLHVCLDEKSDSGMTPLISACHSNEIDYVRVLLANKADPSIPDDDEHCNLPLSIACQNGNVEIVQLLLESNSPTSYFGDATVPLTVAARGGMTKIVYLLLQYGADPNYHGTQSESALDIAISMDNVDVLRALIACGADTHNYQRDGLSEKIRDVFDEWVDMSLLPLPESDPYAEIGAKSQQLLPDIKAMIETMNKYISNSSNIDFQQELITPILNQQNSLFVNFGKLLRRADYFGKVFFQKRAQLFSSQCDIMCSSDKNISPPFLEDEKKQLKMKNSPSSDLDTIKALPQKKKDKMMKQNYAYLLYMNQVLLQFNLNLAELYQVFERFSTTYISLLDQAISSLMKFRDFLLEIRQASFDIVIDPKVENGSVADQTCIEQCEKIQVDYSFLSWERGKFTSLVLKIARCLRQTMR